ncbi:hypothetical protein [Sorangium sp. So ce131]|uniref:hypothetical protein n=1 Tax=Sorangium sp. So ce131 TaxID=3133282 RepID=UPI003F5E82B6
MKKTWICAVALGLFGALSGVGCGEAQDPGASGGGDVEPVALDALAGEFADVYCERIFRCCDAAEQAQLFELLSPKPETQEECSAELSLLLSLFSRQQKESVDAGRQTYDGEKAARCLAEMEGTCEGGLGGDDNPFDATPECSTIFVGKVADGGACTDDDDCSGAGSACTDDVCTPPPAEGEPCSFGEGCQEGLSCEFSGDGMQCVKLGNKPGGEACTASYDCASRDCDLIHGCAPQKENGAECGFSDACKSGYCDAETFTCAPGGPTDEPADEGPVCDGK